MNQLIKIETINDKQVVDARTLHKDLKIGRDFNTWIKFYIKKFDFKESEDFYVIDNQRFPKSGESKVTNNQNFTKVGGDYRSIEFQLTVSMAKELAMLQDNEQGRKIRKYFIAIEKLARERMVLAPEPISVYGNVCHDYTYWLLKHGYSLTSGSVNSRKRNYPQHFKVHNDRWYISEAFGNALLAYRETKRKVALVEGLHQTSLELN